MEEIKPNQNNEEKENVSNEGEVVENTPKKGKKREKFSQRFKKYSPVKKVAVTTGITVGSLVFLALATVGGYIGYVSAQYYRIEDNYSLTNDIIASDSTKEGTSITNESELSITTYNIGFGAYDHDYSFFMDVGTMKDGTVITGKYAKAINYEHARKNTDGALNAVKDLDTDFVFIQEIDKASNRCYNINQYQEFTDGLVNYDSVYASNFHTAYLAYPFNDPIGMTEAGLATYSKYKIDDAVRRSYPVDESFPTKFFDLDRCFSVSRINLSNGKELVLANSHMSAYDEGGVIRKAQLTMLKEFMTEEYAKGNYIVIGGDFNHDLCNSADNDLFPSDELHPDWVASLTSSDMPEGFSIVSQFYGEDGVTPVPTCRAAEMPYTRITRDDGTTYLSNYTVIIDGFIVSNNISVISNYNVDLDFEFSDHNPAKMTFKLNI
jgi:endonuclease/exonuclease/phosphatase family metal-dependent hydrolase